MAFWSQALVASTVLRTKHQKKNKEAVLLSISDTQASSRSSLTWKQRSKEQGDCVALKQTNEKERTKCWWENGIWVETAILTPVMIPYLFDFSVLWWFVLSLTFCGILHLMLSTFHRTCWYPWAWVIDCKWQSPFRVWAMLCAELNA